MNFDKGITSANERVVVSETGRLVAQVCEQCNVLTPQARRLRGVLEDVSDAMFLLDDECKILHASSSIERILGYAPNTCVGKNMFDLVHPDYREQTATFFSSLEKKDNGFLSTVLRLRSADGEWKWMEVEGNNMLGDPAVASLVIRGRDITARTKVDLLQADKARLLDESLTETFIADAFSLKALYLNRAARENSGYSQDEVRSLDARLVLPSFSTERHRAALKPLVDGLIPELPIRTVVLRKDGSTYPIEGILQFTSFGERPVFLGIVRDISERVQRERELQTAEEHLKDSEERFRQFFEGGMSGHFISKPDGTFIACNTSFARLYGYASVAEVLGMNAQSMYRSPEARVAFIRRVQAERKLENLEMSLQRRDGTEVHVLGNVLGIFNDKDELQEIRGSIIDITQQKKLEQQVRQVQKMEELGTLAGGIAHDFNNLLGIILAHTSLLESYPGLEDRVTKSLQSILKAVERGSGLVRQLLTFARKQDAKLEPVSINAQVADFVALMEETLPKSIEIKTDLMKPGPVVQANPNQLHQVLLNLAINARDAMPSGGTLVFRTEAVSVAAIERRFPSAKRVPYVCLSVQDSGSGMDTETVAKIFEPFFTTKEKGRGTGLGLPVVYGIVTGHQGFIDVTSFPKRGTRFSVYLPLEGESRVSVPAYRERQEEPMNGNETILLVEDEELLRGLLVSMLEKLGYTVLSADNGQSAYDLFIANKEKLDLIVTDLGLPKFGGAELVRKIRSVQSTIPVLAASGYLDPNDRAKLTHLGISSFLQKPYQIDELLLAIRKTLSMTWG